MPAGDATPFALSTQLDKGLPGDVDYMALRREEDHRALAVLGVPGRHLGLREAPHRGYDGPAELFAGRHRDDAVAEPLARELGPVLDDADLVLAPQALGDHVDHQWVTEVVADAKVGAVTCYATQVPFQFGSAAATGPALRELSRAEGERCGGGHPAEVLRAGVEAGGLLLRLVDGSRAAAR